MPMKYKPSLTEITDIAVSHGMPPMTMFVQWNVMAEAQLKILLDKGLKPEHTLLDFGCGMGRLAVNAIQYLNDGNYAGIDADERYMNICTDLVKPIEKSCQLLLNREFAFEKFNMTFNYGMAQSVFTHLSDDQVRRCVAQLCKVMAKGGCFVFSYIETNYPIGLVYEGEYPLLHPAHQNVGFFQAIAAENSIEFYEIATPHPTQKWAEFRF